MSATAHPLQWPVGWPRTLAAKRQRARFYRSTTETASHGSYRKKSLTTLADARDDVFDELRRLGARNIVISTDVELRLDGLPRSGRRDPDDPGVAVYFTLDHKERCIPCDKWDRVADNLTAIARTVDALRGIERWGAKSMVDAAFSGFKALPETAGGTPWWETLEVEPSADEEEIRAAYKRRAMETHPDKGGAPEAFHAVQEALRQGLAATGGRS